MHDDEELSKKKRFLVQEKVCTIINYLEGRTFYYHFYYNIYCYMLYACEVWGVHLLGKLKNFDSFKQKFIKSVAVIEKLHLKFCKRVLGVHSKASNAAVYAELGRTPLIVQVSTLVIKYWLRITNPIYKDSLVGKAASLCVRLPSQEVVFTILFWNLVM